MKLEGKKSLIVRTLGVGRDRISFNTSRLSEVKEAITKQDIRDLVQSGVIIIKQPNGRRKNVKRKTRRRIGSVRKKVKNGKEEYMILTRKLRSHLSQLKRRGQISQEDFMLLRKEARSRDFRSLPHMKERMQSMSTKKTVKSRAKRRVSK